MNAQPTKRWVVKPSLWMMLAVGLLSGCNSTSTSQPFPDECAAIRASLASAGGRELTVMPVQRHDQSEESSASYEFDLSTDVAIQAVKNNFPKRYKLVRESPEELNYARTDGGDTVYATVSFVAAPNGKTQVKVLIKSLPS